ncbi:protein MAIN-LIKE 1-like [Trifolium pratense]|uniref:protein MAIN-LIKE 1-like n=1 Tax=Trifolium pratense TaxID=57577 RepID=UPI001E6981A9|nr:protein MAIN-LIKE 1-like [Trifolium pratense]
MKDIIRMTYEVGRQRAGRESRAHSSARREVNPGRSTRKRAAASTSSEPDAQPQPEAQHETEVEQDMDAEQNELDAGVESEDEAEVHQPSPPPPPPTKQRKRNPRTTTGRNPPPVVEPPVTVFGGGPSDLSLLPSFGKHVAAALWRGECTERYLKCLNHGKKINVLDKPDSNLKWFWDVVDASGLRPLLKTNYNHVGWGLLTAFTERWHPETGTFHLPIGEMTITLDDVSCLLHIPISGKMLNHLGTCCTVEEGEDMCEEFLNFSRADCKEEFAKMKGAHIGYPKLLDIYGDNLKLALAAENNREEPHVVQYYRECTVRAFLLYLICSTIFTNKSGQYADVIFLTYLQDIEQLNTWN